MSRRQRRVWAAAVGIMFWQARRVGFKRRRLIVQCPRKPPRLPETSVSNRGPSATPASRYALVDDVVRGQLDRLARLSARICQAPLALVSLVLEDVQIFVGRSGGDIEQTPRAHSFCAHAMISGGLMTVPDARQDRRFCDNPLVTGDPHIRFYAGQPLISENGTPLGSFCVIDSEPRAALSADQEEALATLAEAATALLEKWCQASEHRHQTVAVKAQLAHLEQRFDVLVDALPQLIWSALPNGAADYFSTQWCDFTGGPPAASFGLGWLSFVHPEDIEDTEAAWNAALASGGSYAVNYRLRRHDGEYVWMLARGLPIRDAAGAVVRWIGTCTDIQGQVQAGELQQMMSQELSHRIKNLFAVTQGLIAMTLRNHPELKPVAGEMQSRLRALGRAHDLVRPQFVGHGIGHSRASLHELLHTLMLPYAAEDGPRWQITGADCAVGEQAATPLALFIHESGTNSLKYGALSAEGGHVAITIQGGDDIRICWQEHGGPPVIEPATRGFGYRLADLSIARQLGGALAFEWLPQGLAITATVPAASIASQARTNAADSAASHAII